MTDPGRQRETKYLLKLIDPVLTFTSDLKQPWYVSLSKSLLNCVSWEFFFSNILSDLENYPSRRQLYHRSIVSQLVRFFLEFVYDLVLFYWHLGVERHTAGYVLFVVETVHQLVGRTSLRISQLYRTVPSVFECKSTDDTTKKRSYPKYLQTEI